MQRHKIVGRAPVGLLLLFLPLVAVGVALALMLTWGQSAQQASANGLDKTASEDGAGPNTCDDGIDNILFDGLDNDNANGIDDPGEADGADKNDSECISLTVGTDQIEFHISVPDKDPLAVPQVDQCTTQVVKFSGDPEAH